MNTNIATVSVQSGVANRTPTPADAFRNIFAILHNLDRWELEGVVTDDRSWDRYNDDLTTFVLKLDDARLDKLYALVQERQPAGYREAERAVDIARRMAG